MPFTNLNKYPKKPKRTGLKRVAVILVIVIIALIVPSFFIFIGLKEASSHAKLIGTSYKDQNFDQLKNEVSATKGGLQKTNIALNFLFWLRIIPIVGGYYLDAKGFVSAGVEALIAVDSLLNNLSSSKVEMGFDGHPKSGPDRTSQAVKILNKSLPYLDKVQGNLNKAADDVKNIDVNKYPETFKGKTLKKNLEVAKNFIMGASVAIRDGKQALMVAPNALGIPSAKNYLLLFQNDNEIRATGGFLTAYATLTINNGQVSASASDDIYRLDEKLLNVCLTKICPLTPPPHQLLNIYLKPQVKPVLPGV